MSGKRGRGALHGGFAPGPPFLSERRRHLHAHGARPVARHRIGGSAAPELCGRSGEPEGALRDGAFEHVTKVGVGLVAHRSGWMAGLLLTKTNGFRHTDAIEQSTLFYEKLAVRHGWLLFHTESVVSQPGRSAALRRGHLAQRERRCPERRREAGLQDLARRGWRLRGCAWRGG